MADNETVLIIVRNQREAPNLADAAASVGVPLGAVDADFGVVPLDPREGTYLIEVNLESVPESVIQNGDVFSNPCIEPF
jgi:hypothetical protein